MDPIEILKLVGFIALVPIIFAVPLILFGRILTEWSESTLKEKDQIFILCCKLIFIFSLLNIARKVTFDISTLDLMHDLGDEVVLIFLAVTGAYIST